MATNSYVNPYQRPDYGYGATGQQPRQPRGPAFPAGTVRRPTGPPNPEPEDLQNAIAGQPLPNLNADLYAKEAAMYAQQQAQVQAQIDAQERLQQQLNGLIDPMQGFDAHQQIMALLGQRDPSVFTFLYGY